MTKPDWRKIEDYDYCNDLDGAGFTWEFLRRYTMYKEKFAKLEPADFVDPDKDPQLADFLYNPAQTKRVREEGAGHTFNHLTHARRVAHEQFRLNDMHNPDMLYDPQKVKFDLKKPALPLFIDNGTVYKACEDGGEISVTTHEYDNDGDRLITEVESYSYLDGFLLAIFDTSANIKEQKKQIEAVLNKASNHEPWGEQKAHVKRTDLVLYLRVLDYLESETDLPTKEAVLIIGKDKSVGSGDGLKQPVSDLGTSEAQKLFSRWKQTALRYCKRPYAFITRYSIQNS